MPAILRGNSNVRPGEPCFLVSSDQYDYFKLGRDGQTTYLLEGVIVGPPPEFIFNGRIFVPGSPDPVVIFDNFPKGATPSGWYKRQNVDAEGYDLVAKKTDVVVFGYVVEKNVCRVTTNLYDDQENLIAETSGSDFIIHRAPAELGRGGIVIG